jgi:dihydropyrimidinase
MGLLIKNGEIVTADSRYVADIYCEGETITAIARDLDAPPGTRVVDATGKFVFPGFVDPHTHIYLPFMGTYAKDTYETGTRAALCGGTTTLIDFVIPTRSEDPMAALETWRSKGAGACSDYTYHMAVTRFDAGVEAQLREIVASGVSSFKVFLAYKGAFGLPDDELFKTMRLAHELGVLVTAHCENPDMVTELQNALVAEGKLGPEWHEPSRPAIVEAEGTRHLCTMAELTGAHCYVVHLSNELALRQAVEARYRGVNVYVETLIQYLLLDASYAERPGFEGAKYVMSPPLRDKGNQAVLWHGLKTGLIHTLATDHAPFDFAGQKDMGKDNFTLIPNGIPALEDRIRMLYTHGVATGRLDLHRFVETASTNAAKLFGLFPRKGTIQLGADADLVVFDPTVEGTISAATHHMNLDYNPFEGWPVKGRCAAVTVRGQVQVEDGEFVGHTGIGRFLGREPHHF